LVLGIRSDLVLLERTNSRPAGEVLVHLTPARRRGRDGGGRGRRRPRRCRRCTPPPP